MILNRVITVLETEYQITYTISRATAEADGALPDEWEEIGFGAAIARDLDAALYEVETVIQRREWETEAGMPDPATIDTVCPSCYSLCSAAVGQLAPTECHSCGASLTDKEPSDEHRPIVVAGMPACACGIVPATDVDPIAWHQRHIADLESGDHE